MSRVSFPSPDAMIAHLESLAAHSVAEERRRMDERGEAAP